MTREYSTPYLQEFWLKKIGYATPYFCGSGCVGLAAIPGNPIPRRHPIITVIGDPIECPKIEHPTEADIEKLKVQVCTSVCGEGGCGCIRGGGVGGWGDGGGGV